MKELNKNNTEELFGKRMATLRKAKGMTQTELGNIVGVSKRLICYYEKKSKYPPSGKLHLIAKALNTSTDKLLGLETIKIKTLTNNKKLLKRLKLIDNLPRTDQNALIHFIDLLLVKQQKNKEKH